jgi:prepilin-type N-terminal cleavage/methylation domain-containing protein/prepilin-type processing-associated H-X9-DG protein
MKRKSSYGFTLIELLVVIAIIAILAAILFPVFANAREKGRQASCTSNVGQLGKALLLYLDDFDETYLPGWYNPDPAETARGEYPHWQWKLSRYIGERKSWDAVSSVRTCPSALQGANWTYSYNTNLNYLSMGDVTNPATTLAFGDGTQIGEWNWGSSATFNGIAAQKDEAKGIHDQDPEKDSVYARKVRYRHLGGAIFCFADGHAKWVRRGMLTDDNWIAAKGQTRP